MPELTVWIAMHPARNATKFDGYVNAVLMRGAVKWFTSVPLKKK
ncbi:MAG: hypothetical protein WC340_12190 [Kiritimatiellia bacterium]